MDRFRELWAELATRMPRKDGSRSGPLEQAVIDLKAQKIELRAFRYRRAFEAAYGSSAFKPYTHMTKHLAEQQRRCSTDLVDYNGESTEHVGKEMKTAVAQFTNKSPGKAATATSARQAGFLEQAAMHQLCKGQAKAAFPGLLMTSHERRLQREGRGPCLCVHLSGDQTGGLAGEPLVSHRANRVRVWRRDQGRGRSGVV